MQNELDSDGTSMKIVGVNQTGFGSTNDTMTDGRDLPWLQEEAANEVWDNWKVTYRDVIILNANNEVVSVYNLTDNDLGDAANFSALKAQMVSAAP